jgi:hypothetical protein
VERVLARIVDLYENEHIRIRIVLIRASLNFWVGLKTGALLRSSAAALSFLVSAAQQVYLRHKLLKICRTEKAGIALFQHSPECDDD